MLAEFKTRGAAELRQLIDSPRETELCEEQLKVGITAWAREHTSGKLGVVVEAREARFGGMMHSVSADGFYFHSDGTIEAMKEEDLWDHGY